MTAIPIFARSMIRRLSAIRLNLPVRVSGRSVCVDAFPGRVKAVVPEVCRPLRRKPKACWIGMRKPILVEKAQVRVGSGSTCRERISCVSCVLREAVKVKVRDSPLERLSVVEKARVSGSVRP